MNKRKIKLVIVYLFDKEFIYILTWYLSYVPLTGQVWYKVFFRRVRTQGHSPDMLSISKNASDPIGIPLKGAPQVPGYKVGLHWASFGAYNMNTGFPEPMSGGYIHTNSVFVSHPTDHMSVAQDLFLGWSGHRAIDQTHSAAPKMPQALSAFPIRGTSGTRWLT